MEFPRDVSALRFLGFDQATGEELQVVVGFLELFLGQLPLRDVLIATDGADHGTFRVSKRHNVGQDRNAAAIGSSNDQLPVPQRHSRAQHLGGGGLAVGHCCSIRVEEQVRTAEAPASVMIGRFPSP